MRVNDDEYEAMLKAIWLLCSNPEQTGLYKVYDMLLREAYKELVRRSAAIPFWLQGHCLKCGTYLQVVPTEKGNRCIFCEQKEEKGGKTKVWGIAVKYKNRKVLGKYGISALTFLEVPALFTAIAIREGCSYWMTDPNCTSMGGFYHDGNGVSMEYFEKEIQWEKKVTGS